MTNVLEPGIDAGRTGERRQRLAESNAAALRKASLDIRAAIDRAAPVGSAPAGALAPAAASTAALHAVLHDLGITPPAVAASAEATLDQLQLRSRQVRLEPGWFRATEGHLLGHRADGSPVALLPRRRGYTLVDPATGSSGKVTEETARTLSDRATVIYQPLPAGDPTAGGMARYVLGRSGRDLLIFLLTGLVFGLLSLAVPISVGTLVPRLLAAGSGQVWWLALLVGTITGTCGLMLYVRNAVAIRLQSRIQARLEPAVWDRLMQHEIGFFRQYSTGEIVQRGNAIAQLRRALSDMVVGAALSAFFSLAGVIVVLVVAPGLGLALVVALVVLGTAIGVAIKRQERHESIVYDSYGEVYGMLYTILLSIDKLQAAGREVQALGRWAAVFRRQKTADAAAMDEQAVSTSLAGAIQPVLITALLLAVAAFGSGASMSDLVVASVASGQIALAVGQLSNLATRAFAISPALTRLRPILAEPRRVCGDRDPGRLTGEFTFQDVEFRYSDASEPTLDRVSLHAEPGQMVAVVGPSGAGKSTLIRLLLAFEQPSSGEVRYGAHRLADLDVRLVRRQLGTVMQGGKLLRGTLRDNIVGPCTDVTDDEIWYAAELAGIIDDLRLLPMGLHTRINETGEGFSGGQIQRLLLARALVRRPAVLLLDEATSALDNRTQREISDRIAALSCTRLVIAHRLSTIRRADSIVVLDRGRITAAGTYDQLLATSPMFSRMVGLQDSALLQPTPMEAGIR